MGLGAGTPHRRAVRQKRGLDMASAAGASFDLLPTRDDSPRRRRQRARRNVRNERLPAQWDVAALTASVPRRRGRLWLPRRARASREWATSPRRYRVRCGWHAARVSDNALDLLTLIDGQRSVGELAWELAQRQQRNVHPAEVMYLLRHRLVPAKLVRLPPPARMPAAATLVREARVSEAAPAYAPALAADAETPTVMLTQPVRWVEALPEPDIAPVSQLTSATAATQTGAPQPVTLADHPPAIVAPPIAPPSRSAPAGGSSVERVLADWPTQPLRPSTAAASAPGEIRADKLSAQAEPWIPGPGDIPTGRPMPALRPPASARPRSVPTRSRVGAVASGLRTVVFLGAGLFLLALAVMIAFNVPYVRLLTSRIAPQVTSTRAPSPTATPPRERILPGETAYVVRTGDTLPTIASRFHVTSDALLLVNADILPAPSALIAGMRLAIPAVYRPGISASAQPRPLYYVVRRGDTLYQIGVLFGLNWQRIADFNHLTDPRALSIGQGLVIPPASQ